MLNVKSVSKSNRPSMLLFAKYFTELPRPSARKRFVRDSLTRRDRTIHIDVHRKAVEIKSAAS